MSYRMREKWQELCAKAAVEYDHDKLIALVAQIDRMLTERERSKDLLNLEFLRQ